MDAFMNEFFKSFKITGNQQDFLDSAHIRAFLDFLKAEERGQTILENAFYWDESTTRHYSRVGESNMFDLLHDYCSGIIPKPEIHRKVFNIDCNDEEIDFMFYGMKVIDDKEERDEILIKKFMLSFELTNDPRDWVSYDDMFEIMKEAEVDLDLRYLSTGFKRAIQTYCSTRGYSVPQFSVRNDIFTEDGKRRRMTGVSRIAIWESKQRNSELVVVLREQQQGGLVQEQLEKQPTIEEAVEQTGAKKIKTTHDPIPETSAVVAAAGEAAPVVPHDPIPETSAVAAAAAAEEAAPVVSVSQQYPAVLHPYTEGSSVLYLDKQHWVHSVTIDAVTSQTLYNLNGYKNVRHDGVPHKDIRTYPRFYKTDVVRFAGCDIKYTIADIFWTPNGDVKYYLVHHRFEDLSEVDENDLVFVGSFYDNE